MMDGKLKTLKAGALALLLTAAVFAAIAPCVSAQTEVNPIFTIDPVGVALKPQQELREVKFSVYPSAASFSQISAQPSVMSISVSAVSDASWLTVAVSPSEFTYTFTGKSDDPEPQSGYIYLSASAMAPAFTPAKVKVTFMVTGGTAGMVDGKSKSAEMSVQADYFSLLSVNAAATLQKISPNGQGVYPVTITNLGNAQTKVFVDIKNVPTGWQVVTPGPVTLESTQQGGTKTKETVNIMVQPPYKAGYHNDIGAMKIDITSNYALDSNIKGDASAVSILTRSQGMSTPGFEGLFVIAALGAFMLVSKKKKQA